MRLWLLLLWAVPAGFWLLPRLMAFFPDLSASLTMVLFLSAGASLQGGVLDLIGRQRVRALIREGELWEQAGIRSRAEERYLKAVRVFDSILVSPWFSRGVSKDLTRVMAGFYLSGHVRYPGFRQAAARYLLYLPGDEALALLWIERALSENGGRGLRDSLDSFVLTALSQEHHDNPKLALNLAVLFLDQERSDFPARRLYRSVFKLLENDPSLKTAFPREYGEKLKTFVDPRGQLETMHESSMEAVGETLGGQMVTAEIYAPGREFDPQSGKPPIRRSIGVTGRAIASVGAFVLALVRGAAKACTGLVGSFGILKRATVSRYGKYAAASVLAVCLAVFLWSSLAHMLKSTSTEPVKHPVGETTSGPFTIQVAAYLKQTHAEGYLSKLKDKGLLAHIKKTKGGGKTWYLVRISHFKSKQEASDYGRKLKSQGKIDDFFVSNS